MDAQKKVVKAIAVIMAIIGVIIAAFGLLGQDWFSVVLGVAFVVAAIIAYISGTSYVKEQEEKSKQRKKK